LQVDLAGSNIGPDRNKQKTNKQQQQKENLGKEGFRVEQVQVHALLLW
jgi:hypothetical protein